MIRLRTERLLLREFREGDFDAYARICADPEAMRYLGGGEPLTRSQAWRSMAMILGHWQLRGYGLWAVEEVASGECIGRIGLFNPEGWPGLEVGWLVAREHQGRGVATEGGRAALAHARDVLGAKRVISLIRPANAPSIRVAEKLGARLDGPVVLDGQESLVYAYDLEGRPPSAYG